MGKFALWRHKKRGTIYRVLNANATFNSEDESHDRHAVVIYQDVVHGNIEVREQSEFLDGRFEKIEMKECPDNPSAEDLAMTLCHIRGFAYYDDPLEGGQDAFDISQQALYEAEELLRFYTTARKPVPEPSRNNPLTLATLLRSLAGSRMAREHQHHLIYIAAAELLDEYATVRDELAAYRRAVS